MDRNDFFPNQLTKFERAKKKNLVKGKIHSFQLHFFFSIQFVHKSHLIVEEDGILNTNPFNDYTETKDEPYLTTKKEEDKNDFHLKIENNDVSDQEQSGNYDTKKFKKVELKIKPKKEHKQKPKPDLDRTADSENQA
jgi:hypothetical protein